MRLGAGGVRAIPRWRGGGQTGDKAEQVQRCFLLGDFPVLVWVGAVIALLAVWSHDIRGLYLAGACVLIGTLQAARSK